MVAARSAAMGFNRLVDARMDALNPRTAMREIPRGAMSARDATIFVIVSSIVFVFASWQLNRTCAACCRRSRSRSCSGIRSPSATRPTRRRSSAWRWPWRRSAAGWPPAADRRAAEPWLLGAGDRVVGRRLRHPLRLPGSRLRSRARPALDSGALRHRALAASSRASMHVATVICMAALAWLVAARPDLSRRRRARRGAADLRTVARVGSTICRK